MKPARSDRSGGKGTPVSLKPLWINHGLFSDHYLRKRIKENSWWPVDSDVRDIFEYCKDLWRRKNVVCAKRGKEMVAREEIFNPVFLKLGFGFVPNTDLPSGAHRQEPDYLLFSDAMAKDEALKKSSRRLYAAALTLAEVKGIRHPLDRLSKSQQRYPHQQIREYLANAQDESGLPFFSWAVLTNGSKWRLYGREARQDSYLELDFEMALQSLEHFKYFHALFSPSAFARIEGDRCRLDAIRKEALEYQSSLEQDLRKRIFVVLEELANGFYLRSQNKIGPDDLPLVYESCLIFLYRLLFVLYAEARSLLPVRPHGVGHNKLYLTRYSLRRLVQSLRKGEDERDDALTDLYDEIRKLFHLIAGIDPAKNKICDVPLYNGGLFDPKRHATLERWKVGDVTLARALQGLMLGPVPAGRGEQESFAVDTIDYSELEVRQLGSIYEGLLEFHLVREGDSLALENDRGERKLTGAFYTPDYVVKNMVRETLSSLLDRMESDSAVQQAKRKGLKDNSFADRVLHLNILDPSMGSGHFLTEVTQYLAERIIEHPTTKYVMAPVPPGGSQALAETAYWRRRVVENCVYGVDVNALAVDLAKLSLWLTCIASNEPLSFLDHHLQCGDSLAGAWLKDIGAPPVPSKAKARDAAQHVLSFPSELRKALSSAISDMTKIESGATRTLSDAKTKEQIWVDKIEPVMAPYKALADLWVDLARDSQMDRKDYASRMSMLLKARPSARKRNYFHWELEFPEVFFETDGSTRPHQGFDAVIGNPPYVRIQGRNNPADKEWLKRYETAHKNYDLYVPFIERAFGLCRQPGEFAFIVPNKFFLAEYGEKLRGWLAGQKALAKLVNFGDNQIFEGSKATNYTCLLFCKKPGVESFRYYELASVARPDTSVPPMLQSLASSEGVKRQVFPSKNFGRTPWAFAIGPEGALLEKIRRQSELLGSVAEQIFRGLVTGQDQVYIVENRGPGASKDLLKVFSPSLSREVEIEAKLMKPLVSGEDIQRYGVADTRKLILFPYLLTPDGAKLIPPKEFEKQYPLAWSYFKLNETRLRGREGGKMDHDKWYAYGRSQSLHKHEQQKIGVAETVKRLEMFLDAEGTYYFHHFRVNAIIPKQPGHYLRYLLALLNSRLLDFVFKRRSVRYRGGYYSATKQFLAPLPIRKISFTTPKEERSRLASEILTHIDAGKIQEALDQIRACLKTGKATGDKSDVVHGVLAGLAERMTDLVRRRDEAARSFLEALRDFHGIVASELTPKTKLDSFWKLETHELFSHLAANSRLLAAKEIRPTNQDQDRIRDRFTKAKGEVIALNQQIERLDGLIDKIVFELYGLTEDEIGLVTGSRDADASPKGGGITTGVAEAGVGYGVETEPVDMERKKALQTELDRIIPIIIEHYQPEKIILFGSFVEGKVHEASDLDLAIIKETDRRFIDRMLDVGLLTRPRVGVDFFVYTPDEFESKLKKGEFFFVDEILARGRVLYERN